MTANRVSNIHINNLFSTAECVKMPAILSRLSNGYEGDLWGKMFEGFKDVKV